MKIFIICSKRFYSQIPEIQDKLEKMGHELTLPNTYQDPGLEDRVRAISEDERAKWKSTMFEKSLEKVKNNLQSKNFAIKSSEIIYQAKNQVALADPDKFLRLLDALDDDDDVNNIYTNANI
jgi:transcriptional/translational regulatory protein YebC/TACO1